MTSDVMVLGATGMLGSMVARVCADTFGSDRLITTSRRGEVGGQAPWRTASFDAIADDPRDLLDAFPRAGWIVNTIGLIASRVDASSAVSRDEAVAVNAVFPQRLAAAAAVSGARVVAIATDGVFSGRAGPYSERSVPDATDVYGRSKLAGEVDSDRVMHLRTSIVGVGPHTGHSLLWWLLTRPHGSAVDGYVDHLWSGITTLHYAQLVAGIVRDDGFAAGVHHVVPADAVSKFELLRRAAEVFASAVEVRAAHAPTPSDRRLATDRPAANARRWLAAGYAAPPGVDDMLLHLARYCRQHQLLPAPTA